MQHNKLLLRQMRHAENKTPYGWVYVGSHNLTQNAWGVLRHPRRDVVWVENMELGVLLGAPRPTTAAQGTDHDEEPVTAAGGGRHGKRQEKKKEAGDHGDDTDDGDDEDDDDTGSHAGPGTPSCGGGALRETSGGALRTRGTSGGDEEKAAVRLPHSPAAAENGKETPRRSRSSPFACSPFPFAHPSA